VKSPAELLADLEPADIRLGLERVRGALAFLGDPQAKVPAVLIAGTNGKGSTAALLASMLSAAGYRTGLYTSPHLERVEERVRIDGVAVGGDELAAALIKVRAVPSATGALSYFEALTVAALEIFARRKVDIALLEVGLGGRLDATNATQPVLSLITEIGLDHMSWLGDSLDKIAREKAGVMRSGRPVLTWVQEPEARRALAEEAAGLGAKLSEVPTIVNISSDGRPPDARHVALQTPAAEYEIDLPLPGKHQEQNLALAVAAAEALVELGWTRLDRSAVEKGVAACRWPGRLEVVQLPGGVEVLLDGAHNAAGAHALGDALDRLSRPFVVIFGVLDDKDVREMLPPLEERARRTILTVPSDERGMPAARLVAESESGVVLTPLERALDDAIAGEGDLVVVCGSLSLVGEARALLRRRYGVPPLPLDLRGESD